MSYARQKLFEALYSLVGPESIQKRLSFAAIHLVTLGSGLPNQVPASIAEDFDTVLKKLTEKPISNTSSIVPRDVTDAEGEELAQKILSMFVTEVGGL
jgi:hypothetical protein